MSKLLITASLIAIATACATTPAAADPKAVTCEPTGTPIFQTDKTTRDDKGPAAIDSIYDNGAWQHEDRDTAGKSTKRAPACLATAQLASVKAALKDATWTVTTAKFKCMAMSNDVTIYSASGKEVFRDTVCSGKTLDDKSAAALTTLKGIAASGPTK